MSRRCAAATSTDEPCQSVTFGLFNHLMILDVGVLIAVNRGERAAQSFLAAAMEVGETLRTTAPVVAQVWRDGSRQARLAGFLKTVETHDFHIADARVVGGLLLRSGTSDVVDAHAVALALRLQDSIVTADEPDFSLLTHHLGDKAPRVHPWF